MTLPTFTIGERYTLSEPAAVYVDECELQQETLVAGTVMEYAGWLHFSVVGDEQLADVLFVKNNDLHKLISARENV